MGLKPAGIIVDPATKQIQINWDNGHESVYDFVYLRRACPCAECMPWKEGAGEVGKTPEAVLNDRAELNAVSDVVPIGAYAIQIKWASGHLYGIYSWDYLLQLCPCEEHAGKRMPK